MKKIKILSIVLCVLLCAGMLFCGCNKQETDTTKKTTTNVVVDDKGEDEVVLSPDIFPMNMIYSSGAGGWRTQITLKEDGTFVGDYYDSEMGIAAPGYDYTAYVCEFSGKYEIKEKIDDYSYSFVFTEVNQEKEMDTEWVEDRVRYIYSYSFGVNEGNECILYTPETPIEGLDDECLMWWPYRYSYEEENIDTLECYGLYDVVDETAFFSID